MKRFLFSGAAVVAMLFAAPSPMPRARAELVSPLPPPGHDIAPAATSETVVLSGGCFWGVQGVFQHVRGVQSAVAGYAGGEAGTAHYGLVSTGRTGHAESVEVRFDPTIVSFGEILRIFFTVALDPTQRDRQGPDTGPQYRSEIFAMTAQQVGIARDYIAQLDAAHRFPAPIATRVDPLLAFYPAEPYHQDYLLHHPDSFYIMINDLPKVEALRTLFPERFRDQPITLAARAPS